VRVKNSKKIKPEIEEISKEFVTENKEQIQKFYTRKKGGPYSKQDKEKRRIEVYRLHFEYGYSARKIAEFMKVNRNTINIDIKFLYSIIIQTSGTFHPEHAIMVHLQRLDIQRSRLREQIDNVESFKEKISIERLIFDIDSKILYTHHRLSESKIHMKVNTTRSMNSWMKVNNKPDRFLSLYDRITLPKKAFRKITKIIKECDIQQIVHNGQPII